MYPWMASFIVTPLSLSLFPLSPPMRESHGGIRIVGQEVIIKWNLITYLVWNFISLNIAIGKNSMGINRQCSSMIKIDFEVNYSSFEKYFEKIWSICIWKIQLIKKNIQKAHSSASRVWKRWAIKCNHFILTISIFSHS